LRIRGIRARSVTCPWNPHECRESRRPWPDGLITANNPAAGSAPQFSAFVRALTPRPCGEMISGTAGLSRLVYQRGRSTIAERRVLL
jgi:hypothetical protein